MFIGERSADARPIEIPAPIGNYALLLAIPVLLLGVFPTWTTNLANGVATLLLQ